MVTVVVVLVVVSAIGYVLVSRWRGRPVTPRRMLLLPGLLAGYGLLQLTGAAGRSVRPVDVVLIAVGVGVAGGMGVARGVTVTVTVRQDRPWMRYRAVTLALWAATAAARLAVTAASTALGASPMVTRGPALLISVGVTLLAEGLVVTRRGLARPGVAWQARSGRHPLAAR